MKTINRRLVYINEKYRGRESKLMTDIGNKFLHSIPYLLFVSLPLYALFLKLLYRRQKKFYYADHAVFLIHLYIFTFLFLLIYFGLDRLSDKTHWSGIGFAQSALIFVGLIYTLKGMRNFYEQKWGSTIAKFLLFNILCIVAATILFTLFALFSVFQI